MELGRRLDVFRECRRELTQQATRVQGKEPGCTREYAIMRASADLMQIMRAQKLETKSWCTHLRRVREQEEVGEPERLECLNLIRECVVEMRRLDQKIAFFQRKAVRQS